MLAGVLPGLRELRAPLAAGILWLLAAWLAFDPHVPDSKDTGLDHSLYHLGQLLGKAATLAALAFSAFIAGTLSIALFGGAARGLEKTTFLRAREGIQPVGKLGRQSLAQVADSAVARMDEAFRIYLREPRRGLPFMLGAAQLLVTRASAPKQAFRIAREVMVPLSIDMRRLLTQAAPTGAVRLDQLQLIPRLHDVITRRIMEEFPVLRVRLLRAHGEALFNELDRPQSEAEFRFAVTPPLIALGVVLSVKGSWPVGVAAILVAELLFTQGIVARRNAGNVLMAAIADPWEEIPSMTVMLGWIDQVANLQAPVLTVPAEWTFDSEPPVRPASPDT